MNPRLFPTLALILALLATTTIGASAQSDTDRVAELVDAGLGLLAKDNHLSAAKKFEKARELSGSKRPEPFFGLAELELFRGNYVEAVAAASQGRDLTDEKLGLARADHLTGIAYYRLTWQLQDGPERTEALKNAEAILRDTLEASSGELNQVRLDLARVLALADEPDNEEALALVREYLANQPEDEVDLEARGLLCWFQHATEPSPQSPPGGELQAPEMISSPESRLTKAARKAGVVGVVVIGGIIDEEGRLCGHVQYGLPYGQSRATLEDIVGRWKFKPATYDGKPIPVVYQISAPLWR